MYPLGAVARPGDGETDGLALGIDMARPAFYRIGYNAGTGELLIAYDLGLTPEKTHGTAAIPPLRLRSLVGFPRGPRRLLQALSRGLPSADRRAGPVDAVRQISQVQGWQDFGFRFKEGNDETAWDDAHGIITFRYTEPLTWWMPMPKDAPDHRGRHSRGPAACRDGPAEARTLLSSGYHDADGSTSAAHRSALEPRGRLEHELHARHHGETNRLSTQVEPEDPRAVLRARAARATSTASTSIRARAT